MSEQNQTLTPELVAQVLKQAVVQVNTMMSQAQPTVAPMGQPNAMMPAMQFGGIPNLTGWSVPVEQEINGMTVTLYLNFPAASFSQAAQIIMMLVNSGLQVRAYQKNNGGWGNGGGSYGSRGGSWGGYNRGGYGRR